MWKDKCIFIILCFSENGRCFSEANDKVEYPLVLRTSKQKMGEMEPGINSITLYAFISDQDTATLFWLLKGLNNMSVTI